MRIELPRMGHTVTVCPDGSSALAALERDTYDCLLVDLDMPGADGITVIARAKQLDPDIEAVVLTGKSSLATAVAALRHGVLDYLTKPCKWVDLRAVLARVAAKRALNLKLRALQNRLERLEGKSELIGTSPAMEAVRQLIAKVAPTDSTVLVRGETGTGKELVARALHDQSLRADKPFVAVNCGALPEHLIESELFGHCKGAFTGADRPRKGLFEAAGGGTLFLDEIGELPKSVQAKLLRFLESGEIRRVGENTTFQCDVRIICATHRDLQQMVQQGEFREDLLFRINTVEIYLPPLRERLEDIPALVAHLVRRFRPQTPEGADLLTPEALQRLQQHSWPGNVRELANVVERALILGQGLPIRAEDLPPQFGRARQPEPIHPDASDTAIRKADGPSGRPQPELIRPAISAPSGEEPLRICLPVSSEKNLRPIGPARTLREIELQAIAEALQRHGGNKAKAAEELGISLKTLYNKLNQAAELEKSA
jgi:two-component system NtrC family response regulator